MNPGKLIVLEGISGTGKETQAKLLKENLTNKGITSHIVYHPTPELKEILSTWRKSRSINHITEIYLLLADRSDRVRQAIEPTLAKGEWIISLRNWLSALVYQAQTPDERKWVSKEFSRFEPTPDHLFFFDLTPEEAMTRITRRHQETGEPLGTFETLEHLTQKRVAYQEVLQSMEYIRLAANRSIKSIHQDITTSLNINT